MNETEEFYLNLSGTTVLSGLAKYLIDNVACPLERFLERTYSMYKNIETLFPNMNDVFENALGTGDRRFVQFLKSKYRSVPITLPNDLFVKAWDNDRMELINDLYELNVFPETYDLDKDPIMVASKECDSELMDRLIASGADISRRSSDVKIKFIDRYRIKYYGMRTLDFYWKYDILFIYAAHNGDTEFVEYLYNKGFSSSDDIFSIAVSTGNLQMVKLMHSLDERTFCFHDLMGAYKNRYFDLVDYILCCMFKDYGTELNDTFHLICVQNDIELAEIFLKHGIRPTRYTKLTVVIDGLFEIMKLLIDYGVGLENNDFFAEFNFRRIPKDNEERINEILSYFFNLGGDVNDLDSIKQTTLCNLCANDSNLLIIKKLVEYGAQVNFNGLCGSDTTNYPILIASQYGCTNIVKYLLKNGAYPEVKDHDEMNCFLHALVSQNLETIKLTCSLCDLNVSSSRGLAPIDFIFHHFNSESDAIEVFDYLVSLGVKMNTYSRDCKHPSLFREFYEKMPNLALKYCEWEETVACRLDVGIIDLADYDVYDLYKKTKEKSKTKKQLNE